MAENSKIEWTDHTFNPWEGCQKVGPGCDHCYAETRNARYGGGTAPNWGPGAPRRRTSVANWRKPRAWQADAERFFDEHGRRQRVFCASLADVFDNAIDPAWRSDLFNLICETPNLDWLLLTKRVGNVRDMIDAIGYEKLPENVMLGATIVNQAEADRDVPKLLAVPARVLFLSMEPLLGPVNLTNVAGRVPEYGTAKAHGTDVLTPYNLSIRARQIGWVIVGGESGPGARPMHPVWARSLRDQCATAGVPFLFKQWGEYEIAIDRERDDPDWRADYSRSLADAGQTRWINREGGRGFHGERFHVMRRVGKKAAGRLLDGVEHNGTP